MVFEPMHGHPRTTRQMEGRMTSRRLFLSGSAATLIAVPAVPLAQQALPLVRQPPQPLLSRELKRQLQDAVRTIVAEGRGEGARRAAVVLRLWVAHGSGQGYDAALRDGLAQAIRRRGRDTFLYGQPPHAKMRDEQKAFGLPPQLLAPHAPIDPALRGKTLDQLLREGLTPSLLRTADWFEVVGREMDRRFTQPIRLDDSINCAEMKYFKEALCDMAEAVCYYAMLFPSPLTGDACAVAAGACAGAVTAYWIFCGWRG
jgi:hypothetical protein